ncbi:MAG: hypothetical protein KC713_06965 [Candidatus Omnitrophica bacterium]|nr:hypothetical protein [Candidatus Omnitrophota bacterium]
MFPLLLLITLFAFSPALKYGFIQWDDQEYILMNPLVQAPHISDIKRIFQQFILGNYQPLTVLTFAVEKHIFGLNPSVFHLHNILLHLANVFLVYYFVSLLLKNKTVSVLAAVLFAIHPMRVESVVWVSERKDVLFAFFYLWGLIVYQKRDNRIPKPFFNSTGVFILFLCSLFSKPAAVSFPFILFLLDYWNNKKQTVYATLEKALFLCVSFAFGCVALFADKFSPLEQSVYLSQRTHWSLLDRILLSCHAVILSLTKMLFPFKLSAYYPYPDKLDGHWPMIVYVHTILLLISAILVWKFYKKNKTILFTIGFFLSTIIFNLPIFGAGHTIIADRFGYLPFIGPFIIMAVLCEDVFKYLLERNHQYRPIIITCLVLIIIFLSSTCRLEAKKWRSVWHLWNDVIDKYPNVGLAYRNRGNLLIGMNEPQLAWLDINRAIALNPYDAKSYEIRGTLKLLNNREAEALEDFTLALKIRPDLLTALQLRASTYILLEKCDAAILDLRRILEAAPGDNTAKLNLKQCIPSR